MIITSITASATTYATVGGLVFGATDVNGTNLTIEQEDGWLGSVGARNERQSRPARAGAYTAPAYLEARAFTVAGKGFGRTEAGMLATIRAFSALLADGSSSLFQWADVTGGYAALVQRDGPPRVRIITPTAFEWSASFYAPDPRRYGSSLTQQAGLRTPGGGLAYPLAYPLAYGTTGTGGRVTFTNSGTASTEPVITVTGPFQSGFQITHAETGRRLRYEATVGSDLVIDCGAGTVTTQGQERAMYLTVREWFSVPAGATATLALATLGGETAASAPTAGMTVTAAPAYT